jgi:hypothetical protein
MYQAELRFVNQGQAYFDFYLPFYGGVANLDAGGLGVAAP